MNEPTRKLLTSTIRSELLYRGLSGADAGTMAEHLATMLENSKTLRVSRIFGPRDGEGIEK